MNYSDFDLDWTNCPLNMKRLIIALIFCLAVSLFFNIYSNSQEADFISTELSELEQRFSHSTISYDAMEKLRIDWLATFKEKPSPSLETMNCRANISKLINRHRSIYIDRISEGKKALQQVR